MPTLSYLQLAQVRSLLLVSVLPALSLACNHPSTNGNGGGLGGFEDIGPGGSSAGHSGSAGANGSAGVNGRAGSGAGGSSTGSDGGADAVSSTGGSGPTRGPTPSAPGMKFPFPQNRQSANCVYPTGYTNDVVVAAYNKWKADTVTTAGAGGFRRVKRTQSDYTGAGGLELESTVSEGIALRHAHRGLHERPGAVRRPLEVRAALAERQDRPHGLVHQRRREHAPRHRSRHRR